MASAAALKALPWAKILAYARIVADRVGEDIPKRDRQRLTRLLRKSKGNPQSLTPAEKREILAIVRQVDFAKLSREFAGVAALARGSKLLKPGR